MNVPLYSSATHRERSAHYSLPPTGGHNGSARKLLSALLGGAALLALGYGMRRAQRFSWRGKVVLITGGSRGFGLVLARELAARGARLALCARGVSALSQSVQELRERDSEVRYFSANLQSSAECARLVAEVQRAFGAIDVLVNNAGQIVVGPLATFTERDFERLLEIHLWAPLRLMRAVIPGMVLRGEGRIVNVCSIGGKVAVPHLAPYVVSKFALSGASQAFARELRHKGILVTSVYPGLMRTGSQVNVPIRGAHQVEYGWFTALSSLPFVSLRPEVAARRVLRAVERGSPEVVLGVAAKVAVLSDAVAPRFTARLFSAAARLLPESDRQDEQIGRDIEVPPLLKPFASRIDAAAHAHNQY